MINDITNINEVLLNQHLDCIRTGSKLINDINDDRYRNRLVDMIKDDIANNRSTGHERKAFRIYKEEQYQIGVDDV